MVIKQLKKAMQDLPDPSVTLVGKKYKNPFLVLISCLLSLRTKDTTTLPVSEKLFAQINTIDGFLNTPVQELQKLIYPVGFYKTKAIQEWAERLYQELQQAGIEVLLDDRDERAGVMFNDAELIGIPHRLVLSEKGLELRTVEYKSRLSGKTDIIPNSEVLHFLRSKRQSEV